MTSRQNPGQRVGIVARVSATASAVAGRATRLPPGLVIVIMTICSLYLAYRHALPCANSHPAEDVAWRRACYNDIQPLYTDRGLNAGVIPYLGYDPGPDADNPSPGMNGHNVEYPVLIGAFMALIGLPVHALGTSGRLGPILHQLGFETTDASLVFFWGTAAVLAVLALITTWALLRCRRDRPWDIMLWALAPALMLEATINWDLLAVTFTVLALAAWSRDQPAWAGALLGLGAAAKLYPLVVLGPLVVLCLRVGTPRARDAAIRLLSATSIAWVTVNLPILLLARDGWAFPYRFSQERWIDWGSLWFMIDRIGEGLGAKDIIHSVITTSSQLNQASIVLFALCCAGIAALIWYAPRPPRVAAMAFLVVAAFLLTNKVWSPQFVLWLLPLAVLARPRWGWFLLWQATEVTYLFSVMRSVLGERDWYALLQASVLRWLAVAILCGLVVFEALRPTQDIVRAEGLDDPEGGALLREVSHRDS